MCSSNAVARLQNCLALVAEVTAEAWLLCSDFRAAVPSPFLFLSTPKKHILALSLPKVSSRAARVSPLLNLGIYSLLSPRRLNILMWIPSHSEWWFSLFLICRLKAAFWLVCSHYIVHLHCEIVSNIDWSWTSKKPRNYTFIVVGSMTVSLSLFWNNGKSVRNKKIQDNVCTCLKHLSCWWLLKCIPATILYSLGSEIRQDDSSHPQSTL